MGQSPGAAPENRRAVGVGSMGLIVVAELCRHPWWGGGEATETCLEELRNKEMRRPFAS